MEAITDQIQRMVYDASARVSVGGMATKLQAGPEGERLRHSHGDRERAGGRARCRALLKGEPVGTYFQPRDDRLAARKRWIAFAVPPQGRLTVDAGAKKALTERGKSLLPSGVVAVDGEFRAGEVVALTLGDGPEFARGLVNYDADELRRIRAPRPRTSRRRLGYKGVDEVVHRDNLVIL